MSALGGKADPVPAEGEEGLGLGDSADCKSLEATMMAFTACEAITEAERTRVMDLVTKVTSSSKKLDPAEMCGKMNAILEKSLAGAGCDK